MRVLVTAMMWALAGQALAASAFRVRVSGEDFSVFDVQVETAIGRLRFEDVQLSGQQFFHIDVNEGLNTDKVGLPNLPVLHRLIAVDPQKHYQVEITKSEPAFIDDVLLDPVQEDEPDIGVRAVFSMDDAAYRADKELGEETLTLGETANLAGLTVLPLKITPIHYNPAKRRLTIWRQINARVIATDRGPGNINVGPLTSFQWSQINNLVENSIEVAAHARRSEEGRLLVVTTPLLADKAREFITQNPNVTSILEVVDAGVRPEIVKQRIAERYADSNLDSVLLFGDEEQIRMQWFNNNMPGDVSYSFLAGNDSYADVELGRLPVSNAAEADILLAKISRYRELQANGYVNKRVLLAAHKENYPDKYTLNMENVRQAANPLQLNFTTSYGGAGGLNDNVLAGINDVGYAIVNYRGHGNPTSWTEWAYNGGSFGPPQVQGLTNRDEKLAIFFNIACSNGAIQSQDASLAEQLLFAEGRGAVGVLAATFLSMTDINHRYNQYLFSYLQNEDNLRLGNINALANNRLVRDNGGGAPSNVKMYLLLSDPTLRPWIASQAQDTKLGATPQLKLESKSQH